LHIPPRLAQIGGAELSDILAIKPDFSRVGFDQPED
jgi:hypothetical protein